MIKNAQNEQFTVLPENNKENHEQATKTFSPDLQPPPSIEIWIEGNPIPKARPRVVRKKNGGIMTFTPKNTAEWEKIVKATILRQTTLADRERLLTEELGVTLIFSRKTHHRVDADNLTKAVLDAANTVLWKDDTQIAGTTVFVQKGQSSPGVYVIVKLLSEWLKDNNIPVDKLPHADTIFVDPASLTTKKRIKSPSQKSMKNNGTIKNNANNKKK